RPLNLPSVARFQTNLAGNSMGAARNQPVPARYQQSSRELLSHLKPQLPILIAKSLKLSITAGFYSSQKIKNPSSLRREKGLDMYRSSSLSSYLWNIFIPLNLAPGINKLVAEVSQGQRSEEHTFELQSRFDIL